MAETVRSLLTSARKRLREADVGDEALDARLLLQQAAGLSHSDIIADPDLVVGPREAQAFEAMVQRRLAFEPVSRILGEREFYGRVFKVTPDVLDPRPDTETLIEAALPMLRAGMRIADLGAGSGAIIVTLLAEVPEITGVAADVSGAALAVAEENARRLGVADRLVAMTGSWFENASGQFDLIVSNPPYIAGRDMAGLEPDVSLYDPQVALLGGEDGLDAYRAIAASAASYLAPSGRVLLEVGAGQADDVAAIFMSQGFSETGRMRDLGGHERVLCFAQG